MSTEQELEKVIAKAGYFECTVEEGRTLYRAKGRDNPFRNTLAYKKVMESIEDLRAHPDKWLFVGLTAEEVAALPHKNPGQGLYQALRRAFGKFLDLTPITRIRRDARGGRLGREYLRVRVRAKRTSEA